MSKISIEIGNKFRQSRKMTLDELAPAIHKSRATLSKYERGEISIDIDTLYELANLVRDDPQVVLLHDLRNNGKPHISDPHIFCPAISAPFVVFCKSEYPLHLLKPCKNSAETVHLLWDK